MPTIRADKGFVQVEGLVELQKALRELDKSFPRIISVASKRTAELVATRAKDRAGGVSKMAAKAAESIVAKGEQRGASVKFGSARVPFAMGAEFGSIAFHQFPAWRGSGHTAGYFLFPTIRASATESLALFERELDAALREQFPE